MTIDVIIADDHPLFLDGLCELVGSQPDFEVVAAVDSGEAALEAVRERKPEVLISDISMPGISGIETARQIKTLSPDTKILILSMHGDRRHVLSALDAGVDGYVLKECARTELLNALRSVSCNRTYLSPDVANHVVNAARGTDSESEGLGMLTAREREVMYWIANGKSTKQIAASLGVSPKTVSTHREHLMRKLDLHSIAELTRFALREGLVSDD